MTAQWIAGVDIGGTKIRVAICPTDLMASEIKAKITDTPKESALSISRAVCDLLDALLAEQGLTQDDLVGIGLASAGPLDLEKGEIFNNANLGFDTIPLKAPIQERFPGKELYIINDANAAVLGVHYFEATPEERDNLVYITLSTGIGGGVVCNGYLMLGKEGNAAEIGHAKVEPRAGIACNCGGDGCWEVFSSGTGVRKRALEQIEGGELNWDVLENIVGGNREKITAKEVFQAARKGDPLSEKIVDDCVFYIQVGLGLVNTFYDCHTIYLGGSMMKDADLILPPVIAAFESHPIEYTINHAPIVKQTTLGDEVGLRGALALVKYARDENRIVNHFRF